MAGEYSAGELHVPAWLNGEFFTGILQKSENDPSIEIAGGYELLPATKPGENFSSVMYRTCIRYRSKCESDEQEINLIIKIPAVAEGFKKEVAKDNILFIKEIKMYSEILPAMVKVLNDAGEHLEVARLIHASLQPHVVIVLQSLTPDGWTPGRVSVQSFEEALPTIRNIAYFHAASLYLHREIMDLSTNSVKELLVTGAGLTHFTNRFKEFCDAIEKWDGCESFVEKFKILLRSIGQRLRDIYTPDLLTKGYNVLNHADFTWKNIMHKRNPDGRIEDSMLIDYQACHWGSPAMDVYSLLDLIVDNRTKTTHRSRIVHEYHTHFATVLGKMGYLGRIPTLVDLQVELLRNGFIEVFHVAIFEKYKFIELTETMMDNYDETNSDEPCFNDEEYRRIISGELPSLLYRGLLD